MSLIEWAGMNTRPLTPPGAYPPPASTQVTVVDIKALQLFCK
jgi:hypothetical protein